MLSIRARRVLASLAIGIVVPLAAAAQTVPASGLAQVLRPGQVVTVVERNGQEVTGQVAMVSATAVELIPNAREVRGSTVVTRSAAARLVAADEIAYVMNEGGREVYRAAGSFGVAGRKIRPGARIEVTRTSGAVLKGKVVRVTGESIVVATVVELPDGPGTFRKERVENTFTPADTSRVRNLGRPWDAALIGFVIAAVPTAAVARCCAAIVVGTAAIYGAGIGELVEVINGPDTIYQAAPVRPKPAVTFVPQLDRHRRGLLAVVRF